MEKHKTYDYIPFMVCFWLRIFFFEIEFNSNQTVFGWFVEVNGGLVEIVVFIQSKDIYRFQDSVGYST